MDINLKKYSSFWLLLLFLVTSVLTGCQVETPTPLPTPQPTLTPVPTPVPTREPIGSDNNPIVLGLVSDFTNPNPQETGVNIATFLSNGTGQSVVAKTYANTAIMLYEMRNTQVHIAFLHPMSYLYGSAEGFSKAVLLTSHYGLYGYGTQFLVNAGSGFYSYYDEEGQRNIGEDQVALAQFQGKRPCWVSKSSLAGYLIPAAILFQNGIQTQEGVFPLSTSATIRSLYITGICDFGAVYAVSGDPRTAEAVLSDLTDVRERIITVWKSDAVIPSMNISLHPSIPTEIQENLITSFLVLIKTPEGKSWLSNASQYEMEDLKIIEDGYYDTLRNLLEGFDYNPRDFIGF